MKKSVEVVWSAFPKYGDLYTMEEFKNHMEDKFIIPEWDGSGCYASKDKKTNVYVSDNIEDLDLSYTHVLWFNK